MTDDDAWNRQPFTMPTVGSIAIDEHGIIRVFSYGAERVLGYHAEDVVGQNISMLVADHARSPFADHLAALKRSGQAEIVGSGQRLYARHADGVDFEVQLRSDSVTVEDGNLYLGIVAAAGEASDSQYWLDEFFNLTLDLLAVATFEGNFVRLNPAWRSTTGFSLNELLSRPFMDFVHPEDREATRTIMSRLIDGHQITDFENRYRTADGDYRVLEWNAKPIPERGIIMAAAHDVTRRNRVETQLRLTRDRADTASHHKSEFLSRMSHELRTPLNSIIGFAQLLQMDELNEEQNENIEAILRSGRHLLTMIDEVLEIARIESGNLRLSLEPIQVLEVLKVALDLIGPQATEKSLSIDLTVDYEDALVMADRQRMLQILLNLLSNAVKYNREAGEISVDVQTSGGTVTVSVSDTGAGIPHEKLPALFQPFERLGAEATVVEGTGVGLALSRSLSQEMNGSLTMASTSSDGSVFCLELPEADSEVAEAPLKTLMDFSPPSENDAGDGPSLTVLYIEDNVSNSRLMDRALRTQGGIELVMAVQGSLGFDLAKRLHPGLVLLDLHLPDISGEEVLRQIRATPEIADTAVVVCSADASPSQTRRLIDAGADAYLTKPIDLQELFTLIHQARAGEPLTTPKTGRV